MRGLIGLLFALALVGCDDAGATHNTTPTDPALVEWQIGPIIDGRSSSPTMPRKVYGSFDFPLCSTPVSPDGPSVHYVTTKWGTRLAGTMTLTYRVEASPDAVFIAADGATAGRIALHFQRKDDNWTAYGKYAGYRWYSRSRPLVVPGEGFISVPLDLANWGAVLTSGYTQSLFDDAKRRVARVGFTFGGAGNAGHGVCLTSGTAKFVIESFTITP